MLRNRHLALFAILGSVALATVAHAIVIRHDRDDAQYRQMAADYPMVCRVAQGMGTLVDSMWVITAGHVAASIPKKNGEVVFGDRHVRVSYYVIHPGFGTIDAHRDLALLKLAEPVHDIEPARLYEASDELGAQITFVGDGQFGDGKSGPSEGPRVLRAAENTVDSVTDGWIRFTFDAPPDGDDLEGISGPGDSGGPALLRRGDSLYIIGVSAYNDGDPECHYNSHEFYARVSDEMDWIASVMSGKDTDSQGRQMICVWTNKDGEQSVSREEVKHVDVSPAQSARLLVVVKQLVQAVDDKSTEAYMALLSPRLRAQHANSNDPLDAMFTFFLNVYDKRGPIKGFHSLPTQGLQIRESAFPVLPIVFHLADGMPGYFGIAIDDDGKIDHLSLFVQESICQYGMDCTNIHTLEELGAD